ncbi:TetR family transcriptional regulator [Amphibacillus sediminis]|uniref:TetR family transcriptional regulator n=1 Tax=Amphibacillus sediminis TaxID=360185 RepID=UPI000834E79D|nr:TetR family transcriptional regulator [Amphibacillus sediminis]
MKSDLDPRVIRTRKLIMKAFNKLSTQKEINAITVKDITKEAAVNRATFYYHFKDKMDLIDTILAEDLKVHVINRLNAYQIITKEAIEDVFVSLLHFQRDIVTRYQKNNPFCLSSIEETVKFELTQQFYQRFAESYPYFSEQRLKLSATMVSWALYGAVEDLKNDPAVSSKELVETIASIIIKGMNANHRE